MAVTLTPTQRRLANRFSYLVRDFSGQQIASAFAIAAQERYGDPRFAQLLVQLQLKHVEMSKELIAAFRAGRFSPTAALTRPLLEGAAKLTWAALPDATDERRKRLLRILIRAYKELRDEGVIELPEGEGALLNEAERGKLKEAPNARGAMKAVDRAAAAAGHPEFLESHYAQFGLSSQQLHVHLDGPAVFREDRGAGEMVIFIESRILLGFSALRYAAYYFSLSTQAIAMLVGLDDVGVRIVRRYNAFAHDLEVEMNRLIDSGAA